MLTSKTEGRRVSALDRLAAAPARPGEDAIDWHTPIDRSRWFFCETLTPLYYTAVYRDLGVAHRLRYNQLTAMLANEIIAFMETEFLVAALSAVESRHGDRSQPPDLHAAVRRFRDDERRHADIWHNLNRLSEPVWYASANRRLLSIPGSALMAARLIARWPVAFPVVFWLQLVQEERSLEISRRCMRISQQVMEPRYAAAYGAHLPDEARHVQIDRHLIEHFYRPRSLAVRQATALLFRLIVGTLLVTPVHSAARVVRVLAAEYPELAPVVPRMLRELRALQGSVEYHEMMYSRRTTPVTFALFDEFPEFHQMRAVLRGYNPQPAGRRDR
jgi:para-aminobenzoate N-oxygenase AurF